MVVAAVKNLRLTLVGAGVPGVTFGGVGGVFRIAFSGVTFRMSLLRVQLTDLLFMLVLILELVFVVLLRSVRRPCRPETIGKRKIRGRINRISIKIRGSLGFRVRGGGRICDRGGVCGGVILVQPLELGVYLPPQQG